jgi:hypothetical protein
VYSEDDSSSLHLRVADGRHRQQSASPLRCDRLG